MKTSIKRAIIAVTLALTFFAMLPLFTATHASTGVDPQIIVVPPPPNCVDLGLFAFPTSPKQGDTVTVFVSVTNTTNSDSSFVVDTTISSLNQTTLGHDERVVAVPAQSSINFQITVATSASTPAGIYNVISRSVQGDSLPPVNSFCATTRIQFNLACNSNNCTPGREILR